MNEKQAFQSRKACFLYLKFDESVAVLVLEVVKCLLRVNSTVFSEYYGWEDLVFFRPVEVANVGHGFIVLQDKIKPSARFFSE